MSLGFDTAGSGPTMLLLHPLGADRHVWDRVVPLLVSAGRSVVAVDLPGFGESAALEGDCDPPALARALASWLDSQAIASPHVVGNSLGGWVALELGLSGAARAVTAIAPAGLWRRPLPPKPSVARRLARASRPLIGGVTASAFGRRLVLTGTVAHPERVPAADAARLVRAYASATGFTRVNAAMRANVFLNLADIEVPVTLVWPEHDRLVMRPRTLPGRIANVVIPDAGHIPMLEDPEAVARVLLNAADPAIRAEVSAV
jgi:pimeloyl-ACP methyl ester carboxylesterase